MTQAPNPPPGEELAGQHAALVRGIRRASLAGVLALAGVVLLAIGLIGKARQSEAHAARADAEALRALQANAAAEAQLWKARLSEARATRIAGGPGARLRAAETVANLARSVGLSEEQRLALRSEVIAQLALVDVAAPTNWISGEAELALTRGWFVPHRRTNDLEVRTISGSNLVTRLAGPAESGHPYFSPRGSFLAGTFQTAPASLLCWRLPDGALVFSNRVNPDTLFGSAPPVFSPGEECIAISTPEALEIRELSDGKLLRVRPAVAGCAFSPDAKWLASATGRELTVEATRSGAVRFRQQMDFEITQVAWRPHGDLLGLGGSRGAVALCELPPPDTALPGRVRFAEGHASSVTFAGFTGDGAALLTSSWDGFSIFWDALNGRRLLAESRQFLTTASETNSSLTAYRGFPQRTAPAAWLNWRGYRCVAAMARGFPPPTGVKVSPDRRWLATDHGQFTAVFDTQTGREVARLAGREPEFAGAGSLFTCAGDQVRRFACAQLPAAGATTGLLNGEVFLQTPPGTRANSLSSANNGRTLVVAASDRALLLVDAITGGVQREVAVAAHYARLTPDGDWLVTQFHNGPAQLVRLGATNQPSPLGVQLNTGFDATGRWLGVATEEALGLFSRNATNHWTRQHLIPLETGAGTPPPFTFSPDGQLLAVVFNRFDVRLFDPETARPLATLSPPFPAQIQGVSGLAFSADGHELFAAKQDGEVVSWDLPVLRNELATLGLDWDTPEVAAPVAARHRTPARLSIWVPAAGLIAIAVLLAGLGVFAVQRRMLNAYARAEALAEAHRRKRIEAEVALVQSQKLEALGTLAAGVAHDFNNLLSVIRMSNYFIARSVPADGVTRENLDAIEHAVAQGRDLVRSLLGYARRADDDRAEFSVPQVATDTLGMLSRQFLSGLTLALELDPACPPVRGSSARLEQALLNLVINASEAMHGQGRLVVAARPVAPPLDSVLAPASAAAYVELSVADSGPGIAPETLPRIFEPFFTTKTGGAQPAPAWVCRWFTLWRNRAVGG